METALLYSYEDLNKDGHVSWHSNEKVKPSHIADSIKPMMRADLVGFYDHEKRVVEIWKDANRGPASEIISIERWNKDATKMNRNNKQDLAKRFTEWLNAMVNHSYSLGEHNRFDFAVNIIHVVELFYIGFTPKGAAVEYRRKYNANLYT